MRRRFRSVVVAAICCLAAIRAVAIPAAVVSDSPAPDAVQIYDRARAAVAARRLPPFIAYTQYAAFMRHGKVQAESARVVIRTADGKANITRLPESPADRVDTTPAVARPLVYPTTSFGLVKKRAGEDVSTFEAPPLPAAPDAGGPAVIGRVNATARDYDPRLTGVEMLAGTSVYHLVLVPRFDPRRHPIRAMYVDTLDFNPRRITIEVWAQAGPVRSRPSVDVDFAPVNGTWLITHASMNFVLRLMFFAYGGSAEFRTSDVSFPAAEPDWLFDSALLRGHRPDGATPAPTH